MWRNVKDNGPIWHVLGESSQVTHDQSFDIRLEDEPQARTMIHQNLVDNRSKSERRSGWEGLERWVCVLNCHSMSGIIAVPTVKLIDPLDKPEKTGTPQGPDVCQR